METEKFINPDSSTPETAQTESTPKIPSGGNFTATTDSDAIRYSHNEVNDLDVQNIVAYLRKGYAVEVTSWCTGATRVQMVVNETVAKVKEIMGENAVDVTPGEYYSDRYPSYTLRAKTTENEAETTLKSTSTTETVNSLSTPTERRKHQAGDLTDDGLWVWTEYLPGKFDWRRVKQEETTK
jgi:hypothetical protein